MLHMEDTCNPPAVCYTVDSKLSEDEELSKIAKRRKEEKLSQQQLADMASAMASNPKYKIARRSLQDYELGARDINKCAAITVYYLAQALGCKMEDLLELEGSE